MSCPLFSQGFFCLEYGKKGSFIRYCNRCFKAYINGRAVADDYMSPGWTDYRKRIPLMEYDVTALIRDEYEKLIKNVAVKAHIEKPDWEYIYKNYGVLSEEVRSLNTPDTITDGIDPKEIENNWEKIRQIVKSVPSRQEIYDVMKKAGCATSCAEIAVSEKLKLDGLKYHPFMRRRLSLMRLKNMID